MIIFERFLFLINYNIIPVMEGFIKIVGNGVNGTNVNFILFHLANGSFILPITVFSIWKQIRIFINRVSL